MVVTVNDRNTALSVVYAVRVAYGEVTSGGGKVASRTKGVVWGGGGCTRGVAEANVGGLSLASPFVLAGAQTQHAQIHNHSACTIERNSHQMNLSLKADREDDEGDL